MKMASKGGLLNDVQLRRWIKAGEPLSMTDGDGLLFTLSAAGHAAWVLRYRHGSRRPEMTLGPYPAISLAEARTMALVKRAEIAQGKNPIAERRKAKTALSKDWSMRQLAKDYREKVLVTLAKSTQVCYSRHLKRIEKRLGSLGVSEVEASDIVALIEESSLTWGESNLLHVTAKCLFTHACGKRLINANPCIGIMISAVLGPRPPVRKRLMLTREELHRLLNAPMRPTNALPIRILLATGVRGSELYTAQWKDVHMDEARWHIPASKTGPAMDVPLAPVLVEWFKELRPYAHQSVYVLPARAHSRAERNGGDTHVGKDTVREAIDYWIDQYRPAVRRFTPHDLRSTMKSHMRALGVPRDISEMCLNHKLTGVEGIYDQHNYYPERRQALLTWVQFLMACEADEKIVPVDAPELAA
jgi:integrase